MPTRRPFLETTSLGEHPECFPESLAAMLLTRALRRPAFAATVGRAASSGAAPRCAASQPFSRSAAAIAGPLES
jgi:hypothetical protein